jgi:hypothetical protein
MTLLLERPRTPIVPERPVPATSSLPAPVARWLRVARPELDARPDAIFIEGPARFKRGRLPYLPLRIRAWNRLGRDRVSELEVRILGLTVLRGLDAYVDGRGFTRVGSDVSTGPGIDQAAFHVMFLETLLVPSAWTPEIRWEPMRADAARVLVPFRDAVEEAVVTFDPATGLPQTYATDRYRTPDRPKVWWTAMLGPWRSFGPVFYPETISIQWADDELPWLQMRIARASADPDMTEPLARARAVLDGEQGTG